MLGLPVGSFSTGAYADAVALDLDDLSLQPLTTLGKQVVSSMQATAVARVMVGGRTVVERGRLQQFDVAELRDRIARIARRWL
jgi:cytosine/adenosine deaminase-related metal-dependent hydrolase